MRDYDKNNKMNLMNECLTYEVINLKQLIIIMFITLASSNLKIMIITCRKKLNINISTNISVVSCDVVVIVT